MAFEQIGVEAVIDGLSSFKKGSDTVNKSLDEMSSAVKTAGLTWTEFLKGRMGPAMKEYGSHAEAMKHLSEQYKAYKASLAGAASETGAVATAVKNLNPPLQSLSTSLSNIAKQSLAGVIGGVRSLASSLASIPVSILETAGRAFGNILQIAGGILTAGLFRDIASGLADITRQAFEAAANFQTLQIQMQGLIALQITDQFAANNMVAQSFEQLVTLTGEESEELQNLTLKSSDLHSKMELLERKIPSLAEKFGESSAEVNLAQNQLTRYGIELANTDARIAELNAKNGAYVTVTKLVAGATLDMATAQAQAEGPARDLLQWIEDFGIRTPFTIQQLSEMVRGFLSIGMGIDPTKQLTGALASLGAGLGLTQAQLDRIVANILQTSRSMKITERDIREFGNAGVPVNRVLDKIATKLGITREAALEFAKSGAEGVKAFTDAIIEVGEKDFPDALDNLSRTWAVAASNIQDVIQSIFGKEVLGPLLARLGIFIGDAVEDLISMREVFRGIGETVGKAFDSILPSVLTLANSVGQLVTSLFTLAGIDLSQFDINTAIETAAGIIKGFLDGLTDVSDWFKDEIIPKAETVKQWFIDNWPKAQEKIDAFLGALNLVRDWFEREALPKIQTFVTNATAELEKIRNWIITEGIPKVNEFVSAFNFQENLKATGGDPFAALSLSITGFIQKLSTDVPQIGVFLAAIQTAFVVVGETIAAAVEVITPSLENLGRQFEFVFGDIDFVEVFVTEFQLLLLGLAGILEVVLIFILGFFKGVVDAVAKTIEVFSNFNLRMNEVMLQLQAVWKAAGDFFTKLFQGDLPGVFAAFVTGIQTMLLLIQAMFDAFVVPILGVFAIIGSFIAGWADGVIKIVQTLSDKLVGHSIIPEMMQAILDAVKLGLFNVALEFNNAVLKVINDLKAKIEDFVQLGKDFALGIARGILLMANQIADAAVQTVKDAIDAAGKALDISSPSKVSARLIGEPFGEGIAQGILNSIGAIEAATAVAVQPPVAAPAAAFASGSVTNIQNNTVNADVRDGVDIELLALRVAGVMQGAPSNG